MVRRFQNRQFQQRRPPNRSWSGVVGAVGVIVAANSKTILATFAPSNPGIDETVLRSVGAMSVVSDQVGTTEEITGAVGMRIFNDTAVAAGIASLPDPVTDVDDDGWFFYQAFNHRFSLITAAGFESPAGQQIMFDSKAKRIVEEGSTIVVVVGNASATTGFIIQFSVRVLGMVRGTG